MNKALLEPEEHVLSTLEKDGSRRWLKPTINKGKLYRKRQALAYVLIAIFTLLPFIRINGMPAILLDLPARRFTFFGFTFLPTDTLLLALFMVSLLVTIFLLTALFGRIWCGWACPQTVYMEYVFRPIERIFDRTIGRGGNPKGPVPAWKVVAKYAIYFVVCLYLANTFLAYFVGVEELSKWVRQSPLEHPVPFLVMGFVTCAMMFDFCFFREQLCIIACPYGRFQSVLLDQNSLIVAYDERRGEPRGRGKRKNKIEENGNLPVLGDCVDCHKCVTTCPTGIDIRNGLQMECVNCTQCIDACNAVMDKVGLPRNLIRYSSQSADAGKRNSLFRPRTLVYPLLLLTFVTLFVVVFTNKSSFDVVLLREPGLPHTTAEDGRIRNMMRLKLTNRTKEVMTLNTEVLVPEESAFQITDGPIELAPNQIKTFHAMALVPKDAFSVGRSNMKLKITNENDESQIVEFKLIGPYQ